MNLLRTPRLRKSRNKFRDAKKAYIRAASGKIELKKATPVQINEILYTSSKSSEEFE